MNTVDLFRRPLHAAVVAAVCLAVAAPPTAGAAAHRLTVTGPGSGYVDVELGSGNSFDLARATFRGGRTYVGVVLTRLGPASREDSVVAMRFPGVDPYSPPRPVALGHVQPADGGSPMAAGTYRVYLLADGPATVSFPAARLRRDVTLRVARAVTPRVRLATVPTPLDPGVDGTHRGEVRHPFRLDGTAMVIYRLAAVFGSGPVEKHGAEACDTRPGAACYDVAGPYAVGRQSPRGDRWVVTGYVPRDLWAPGTYDVLGTCYALQPVPSCRLFTLDRFVSTAAPRGRPPDPGVTAAPDVSEIRTTVSLAAQGMSDREIARVLNCSVRTVTRRFSGAMRHYGARSRFHLGFVVASLGEPAD